MILGRIKKINYEKKMKPIYILSMEANQIYMNDFVKQNGVNVKYKIKDKLVDFKNITTRQAVLNDSLFLRFMRTSITRNSGDKCNDFIVVKFKYDANFWITANEETEEKIDKHSLRNFYYKNGVDYVYEKKNKNGDVVERKKIHYKMLMRSPGKAKKGECIFIRDSLHHKAINFLTMGLYDLMDEQSKNDPEKVFRLVELSAYQTLITATSEKFIHIPLENILILEDEKVYSDPMNAAIVSVKTVSQEKETEEYVIDFDSPRLENIINKKGYTFDKCKEEKGLKLIPDKTKEALKECGFRINGKYPGKKEKVMITTDGIKKCVVDFVEDEEIENILWDGMGLIDESIFPKEMNGFIYCRSHFFKSCLFRGNIQEFFRDYCNEHDDIEYDTFTLENIDRFGRRLKLSDIKVVISDKSIKWLKFVDMMGETEKKAYKYYRRWMNTYENCFSIVKTAHPSKWCELQLMAYQMNNSLPTTNRKVIEPVTECAVNYLNGLKKEDEAYLRYLEMRKNNFNINELILDLVKWNSDFLKSDFFRTKKSKDISKLKSDFCQGRLPQYGDNLTIMDNPIAMLIKAVGGNPLDEGCFEVMKDGVQCYTPRFAEGNKFAAFRSPHNSPNNIIHLYNVYPEKLVKYFPNIGNNVIVFNAIKTDTQARLSGHDVDSDFVYVTNQKELADLARKAYAEYPTIINKVDEVRTSDYCFTLEDYARMDNQISDTQTSIGTSTDTAQLALSYYYDGNMEDKELEEQFIILSVLGQISIDLAKKTFDIDVVKEIQRIKKLSCMNRKDIPLFFANTKKSRNNKEFKGKNIRSMNCPMDIMADIIKQGIISYADREKQIPLEEFLNPNIKGKGNRFKEEKVINAAKSYKKTSDWIESHKSDFKDSDYLALKNNAVSQFLNRVSKTIDQETVMQLLKEAIKEENGDVTMTILNFLYKEYKEELLKCFKKTNQNDENICEKIIKTA